MTFSWEGDSPEKERGYGKLREPWADQWMMMTLLIVSLQAAIDLSGEAA